MYNQVIIIFLMVTMASAAFGQVPQVVSASPVQNALNVPVDSDISITFSTEMAESTINTNTFLVYGNYFGYYSGNITYDSASQTAHYNPQNDFAVGEIVSVTLTENILSSTAIPLDKSYSWNFTAEVEISSAHFINGWYSSRFANGLYNICAGELSCDTNRCIDLALANRGVPELATLLNDCSAGFDNVNAYSVTLRTNFILAADVNGDYRNDLITATTVGDSYTIHYCDTSCAFSTYQSFAVGHNPLTLCAADFDGDGDLDIAVPGPGTWNIVVFINEDGYSFTETTYTISSPPVCIIAADIDNDYDLDIITSNDNPALNITVFINNGNAVFSDTTYSFGFQARYICALDCDEDNDIDFAATVYHPANPNDSIAILLNDSGHLSYHSQFSAGEGIAYIAANDFDGDGDIDLASLDNYNYEGEIHIFQNNGNYNFDSLMVIETGDGPTGICSGDFDGDGTLDIAVACNGDRRAHVHLNFCYQYLSGDANMYAEIWPPQTVGGDVTYLVNYFRGLASPCIIDDFYATGDTNGDCLVVGGDVTYLVNYLRGLNDIGYCPDFPPCWQSQEDLPSEAPLDWPVCN